MTATIVGTISYVVLKAVVAQFEFFMLYSFDGVIPKDRVLTSGPRDLRWHSAGEQEILRSA